MYTQVPLIPLTLLGTVTNEDTEILRLEPARNFRPNADINRTELGEGRPSDGLLTQPLPTSMTTCHATSPGENEAE